MSLFGSNPAGSFGSGGFGQNNDSNKKDFLGNKWGQPAAGPGLNPGGNAPGTFGASSNTLGQSTSSGIGNFGSSSAANSTPSTGGSLFGASTAATSTGANTGANTNKPSPFGFLSGNSGTGATGASSASQTGSGINIFGQGNQNNPNNLNPSQAQAQLDAQNVELLPPLSTDKDTQKTTIFVQLLEGAKNLPSINTQYGEILYDTRELRAKMRRMNDGVKSGDKHNTKAHYLLANSGINYEEIGERIDRFIEKHNSERRSKAFMSQRANLDNFLRIKKEANILAAIDESVRFASKEFDWFLSQKLTIDWKQKKHEVYRHFGLSTSSAADGSENDDENAAGNQSLADLSTLEVPYYWGKTTLGRKVLGPLHGDSEFVDVQFYRQSSTSGGVDYMSELSANDVGTDATSTGGGESVGPQLQALATSAEFRAQKFAFVVNELNDSRQLKRPYPLSVKSRLVCEQHAADMQSKHITDCWKILSEIIGETQNSPIPSRQYRDIYQCKSAFETDAITMRERIIKGSKKYLTDLFRQYIDDSIEAAPEDAQLGGVPTVANKIKAFVHLKYSRGGQWWENLQIINGLPFWAMVYYMIRCDYYKEALKLTKKCTNDLEYVEADFLGYISNFVSNDGEGLSPQVGERMRSGFQQRIADFNEQTDDPFRYAVFQLIGRCNLARKSLPGGLTSTAEDWIWVQLMLAKEEAPDDVLNNDFYNLLHIQELVKEHGASFFNPNGMNPGLLMKIYVLCGLFEQAVMFGYSFSKSDAVQLAIAFDYYGLLNVISDPDQIGSRLALLQSSGNKHGDDDGDDDEWDDGDSFDDHYDVHHPLINFARLVGQYTKSFRRSDPKFAVDYLVLLTINSDLPGEEGRAHITMCHEALRELVLETREFADLLGDILADGTRVAGAIERRMELIDINNSEVYLHTIAEQAAQKADEDGRTADAVLLYQLSEEYDTVLSIINKAVGEALMVTQLGQSMTKLPEGVPLMMAVSESPTQVARSLLATYKSNSSIIKQVSNKNRETCESLLKIVDARELFAQGRWAECLEVIEASQVMYLKAGTDLNSIRHKSQQFLTLHDSLARNVPSTMVMAMRSCVNLNAELKQSRYVTATTVFNSKGLKETARNVMIYAGMIHYRMSRDTYSELTRLEAML